MKKQRDEVHAEIAQGALQSVLDSIALDGDEKAVEQARKRPRLGLHARCASQVQRRPDAAYSQRTAISGSETFEP